MILDAFKLASNLMQKTAKLKDFYCLRECNIGRTYCCGYEKRKINSIENEVGKQLDCDEMIRVSSITSRRVFL